MKATCVFARAQLLTFTRKMPRYCGRKRTVAQKTTTPNISRAQLPRQPLTSSAPVPCLALISLVGNPVDRIQTDLQEESAGPWNVGITILSFTRVCQMHLFKIVTFRFVLIRFDR